MVRPPWPAGFAAAMTLFRQTLRNVPPSVLHSPAAVQRFLQPVLNTVAWPSLTLPNGVSVQPDTIRGVQGEWLLPEQITLDDAERLLSEGCKDVWNSNF